MNAKVLRMRKEVTHCTNLNIFSSCSSYTPSSNVNLKLLKIDKVVFLSETFSRGQSQSMSEKKKSVISSLILLGFSLLVSHYVV